MSGKRSFHFLFGRVLRGLSDAARGPSCLLIVFVSLNAVLCSTLLPLWEGFDEPFHFGYVQQLANGDGLPDARTARLSREVAESILRAPASYSVKANLPEVIPYSEFFSWPYRRRWQAHESLRDIPRPYRWQPSEFLNYEAQQAPLAYILLALPERLLASMSLPSRVLTLRILAALVGLFLLYAGASSLCSQLEVGEPYRTVALFCAFSSQMTWATMAHVANDWLAVPLAIWVLVFLIRCAATPTTLTVAAGALLLSAGLLTKAYFLALVPVSFGICAFRCRSRQLALFAIIVGICAVPWYVRNYRIYGAITGMQEERAGIGASAVLHAAPALNWRKVATDAPRSALWTANNTFRTFSTKTIDIVLFVWVAGLLLWALSRHTIAEWAIMAYFAAFLAALGYDSVVAYISTRGMSSTPSAWYAQVLVAPALILAVLGTKRWQRAGLVLAVLLPLLFGYVLALTYVFKLIPLYAGYEGRGSIRNIVMLYRTQFQALSSNLGSVALGSAPVIFGLTLVLLVLILALEIRMIGSLLACRSSGAEEPAKKLP